MEALLEDNVHAVRHMVRAGNVSAERDAGDCAKVSKKRDAPESATEDAPSSGEDESNTKVAPAAAAAIGKDGEDAGEDTWAAVNTICETYDNLSIDPKELRAAVLG